MANNTTGQNRREDWETPTWLYDYLVTWCGFDFRIDLAASKDNTKTRIWIDSSSDFLKTGYRCNEWAWCNPPYKVHGNAMKEWSRALMQVNKVVCLVPATVGAVWFQPFWDRARAICFLRKRLKFELGGNVQNTAMFDSALVVKGWNPFDEEEPPNLQKLAYLGNVVDCYQGMTYRGNR